MLEVESAPKHKHRRTGSSGSPGARDFAAIALAYAKRAAKDTQGRKHCKWVRQACQRHLDDLKRAKKGWDHYFDRRIANQACEFVEELPHVQGEWETPTIRLEAPQIFILAMIFGWRRVDDGKRRFTYAYVEMARKGGKSVISAGAALYGLCCEHEVGPQVIVGAPTAEQTRHVFDPARKMVDRTPDLRGAFGLETFARSITCRQNGGFIQTVNSKGKTQDGWNPHISILDELHAHGDRALFDVMKSARGARTNPLMWIITTAGYNLGGICYEQRQYITKVLDGALAAEHAFGIIFTLDEGDDPFEEKNWVKANPLLGVTPTLRQMREDAIDARAGSDGEFKTKNLNLWLNSASAWLKIEKWNECADEALDWKDFEGLDCWIGADLADKDDICAAVLAAFTDEDVLLWKPMFWLPDAVLHNPDHAEGRGVAPYRTWAKDGYLNLTPGDWVDHGEIEDQIRAWLDRYGVRMITFDQFAAAQGMAVRLNEDRPEPIAQILHKKASNVTDPAKDLEARVKAGPVKFRHDGNPIMTWMASNVVVDRRVDGSILPKKESAMSAMKIDGIDAGINAIAPAVAVDDTESEVIEVGSDYRITA